MGRVQREGREKGWKKKRNSSPCPESAGSIYLPGPFVGPCPSLYPDEVHSDRSDEIQFFPFYRPSSGLPLSRKSSPCDAPHAVVVGRICKFPRHIVSASCPLLTPSPSTKDSGQTFIRLRIFIFRSSETTKRVTPYRRKGDGTPR